MSDQPLDDLLARLEREREEADRLYNEALTAVDRAVQTPPVLPDAPKPLDASRPVFGGVGATNEVQGALKAALGGIRAVLWRILGSPPGMEQRFQVALAQHANWNAVAQVELRQTVAALLETARSELNALARFESLLVQYLQTITLYVDTKDRSIGGTEFRDRLSLLERRLMLLKREPDAQRGGRTDVPRDESDATTAGPERAPATIATASTLSPVASAPPAVFSGRVDSTTYVGFEDRFRGSREDIRRRIEDYVPLLANAADILDVGCGRGELLDLLHAKGISARGVDANHSMVELCRTRGLDVERSDALTYLAQQADGAIGGLVAVQVVEHFEPAYLVRFLETAYHKMKPDAPLILETINPVCWMAFFETYIRDLTHQRPLHPDTLRYLVESTGFSRVDVRYRSPVTEGDRLDRVSLPPLDLPPGSGGEDAVLSRLHEIASALNAHADKLNARLFSSMDYVVIARR